MLLLSNVLAACTGVQPTAPVPNEASTSAPASPPGWANILGPVSAPENWQVEPCTNPVLLCVKANGELIGTVERFSYPLSEVNVQAGASTGAPTTEAAQRQFLQAWVSDHYTTIEQDRKVADPALRFVGETPAAMTVGSLAGLRYGYTITHPNGALFDRAVGYVATDGSQVHVFVTGVISGDPSGSFSDDAAVETFVPYLDTIIQGLRL
jgi:hypothetical protein